MARKKAKLGANIAYMTIYHIINALFPVVTTPYLSRVLGATEIGKYSYAYSLAYYFVLVANLGITTHGSRRIAEAKNNKEEYDRRFSDLFWLHFFNAAIVSVVYLLAVLLGMNRANATLSLIMMLYVLSSVLDVKWLFYGLENFKVTVLRNIIIKIIYIACIFIFVKTRDDIAIYTFIMAFVAYFLAEASLFVMLPRYGKVGKPNFASIRKEILPIIILFVPSVANLVLRHFDKIMLGWMSSYEQLGLYENTDKIFLVLVTLITAVGDVMLPRISNLLASENRGKADVLFHNALRLSIIVSCAFCFGMISISNEFVPLFFGNEFLGCIQLLIWISPSIVMLAFSTLIRKQYLIPRYLEKVYLTATLSSLVINIVANAIFIPRYGALGAIYGTLIAEMAVVAIQFLMIHKMLDYTPFLRDLIKHSVIGAIMLCVVRLVAKLQVTSIILVVLEVAVGAIVYILLTVIVMKITNDSLMEEVKAKISNKKNG